MELVIDGFKLMCIGMGWVFIFLILMIALISLSSKLLAPYSHIFETPAAPRKPRPKPPGKESEKTRLMAAAAAAAVQAHRKR